MPANMPHKGLPVLAGRLDPSIWGRFPLRNMLNGIDGEMILHGYGSHGVSSGDPRLVAAGTGTAASTAGEIILTTQDDDGFSCTLGSNGKVKLAGNRFVLQCGLKLTGNVGAAVLLGFAADAADPLPGVTTEVTSEGVYNLKEETFGIFKPDDDPTLFFASRVTGGLSVLTSLGVDVVDGANIDIKMVSDGKGNIEVSTDGVLRKKIAYPGVANGHLVLGVKTTAAAEVLNLGSAIAFGVAE